MRKAKPGEFESFLGMGKKAKGKRTVNQLYKEEIIKTGKKIDFKKWLGEARESGLLDMAISKVYKKGASPEEINTDLGYQKKKTKIMGMPPWAVYTGGAVVVGIVFFGLFKAIKPLFKAKTV